MGNSYNFAGANRSASAAALAGACRGVAATVNPAGFCARFARSVTLDASRQQLRQARADRINAYRYGFRLP